MMILGLKSLFQKWIHTIYIKFFWEKRGVVYKKELQQQTYLMACDFLADMCAELKPKTVLEYGCGYAFLLKRIFAKTKGECEGYYGIDLSRSQVREARSFFPEGEIKQCNLLNFKKIKELASFDVVIGLGVLMYIHPDEIDKAMQTLFKLTNRRLLLVECYYKYLTPEKKRAYESVVGLQGDGRYIYDYEILLKKHGFENIQTIEIPSMVDRKINIEDSMPHILVIAEK